MALTIVDRVVSSGSLTGLDQYNGTNADIMLVRDAERTSGNHFIWNSVLSPNNGTHYAGLNPGTVPGVWQMMYEGPINAQWFGAKADGSDARGAIQAAIDFAALTTVLGAVYLPNGQYLVNSAVKIKNGLRAFYGPGKLKAGGTSFTGEGVIALEGIFFTTTPAANCRISISEIDANSLSNFCIFFGGGNFDVIVSDIICSGIKITKAGIQLNFGCYNNIITENKIYLPVDTNTANSTAGINVIGSNGSSTDGYYFENSGVPTQPANSSYNNFVTNNYVSNGNHGVQLIGAVRNYVTGNNCTNQSARSIILCQACFNNFIEYNICTFFGSSGIHMCYNSHNNTVSNNFIYSTGIAMVNSTQSYGEGGIQAYIGCTGNTIQNNVVNCNSNYGIYIAVTASNNIVSNNEVYGFVRAGIALESDWDIVSGLPSGAAYSKPNSVAPTIAGYTTAQWPFTGSNNNIISNNIIGDGYSAVAAAIYIASIVGMVGTIKYSVDGTIVKDNTVATSNINYECYLFAESLTNVSAITMNNNNFKTNNASKFYFSAGRSHFFELENNSVINNGVITITGATPNVSVGKIFICGNTSATNVTNFLNGKEGQEIVVRLNVNTTIVNNSSLIKLKGGVNATGNADNFITLLNLSGLWFERNRNF